ncbi:hypothetical protein FRB99_003199, partial [Tulasnella sp. 403]
MPPKHRAQTIYSSEVEDTTVRHKNGQSWTLCRSLLLPSLTASPLIKESNQSKTSLISRSACGQREGKRRRTTSEGKHQSNLKDKQQVVKLPANFTKPKRLRIAQTHKQRLPTVHESLAPSGFRHLKSNQLAPTNSQHNHTAIPPPPHTYSSSQPLRITSVHSGSQHGPDSQQQNDPSDVVDDQPTPALHPATKPIPNPYAGMEKRPVDGDMSVPSDLDIPEHQPDDYDNDSSNEDGNYEHNGGACDEAVEHGGEWDYIPSEDWPHAEEGDRPAVDLEQEHQTSSPKCHHHACHSAKASDTNNPPPTPATRSAAAAFPRHIYLLVQHACYYIKA